MPDSNTVYEFLQTHFDPGATSVSFIGAGWFSQAFTFTVDQHTFVFRGNTYEEDFQKNAFAFRNFSSPALPIPKIVRLGRFDETRFYAMTGHCAGESLDEEDTPSHHTNITCPLRSLRRSGGNARSPAGDDS